MVKKKKNYNYYKLNVGFFPDIVKLCFDDKVFQQILKDHDVTLKANALDSGIAETHLIGDGKDAIIILVFDMSLVNDNLGELVDTIAHIGEEDNFVNETRAYLSGHLAGQIFKICMHEKEKHARKAGRKILNKKSKGVGGTNIQVDLNSIGSAGQDSVSQQPSAPSGTQDRDGQAESETRTGF